MSTYNTPTVLAGGIRNRMARLISRVNPNRWAETMTKLNVMQAWLLEAEHAGRR